MSAARAERPKAAALVALAVLATAAACADLLGIDADRHVATGAGAVDAASKSGPWDCLNEPNEVLNPNARINLSVLVNNALDPVVPASQVDGGSDINIASATPYAGVLIHACPSVLDLACRVGAQTQVSDDAGIAKFSVEGNFAGFFQATRSDLLPYTFYPGNLPGGVDASFVSVGIVSQSGAQLITGLIPSDAAAPSFQPGSAFGLLFFSAYDCNDDYAPGVSVSLSSGVPQTIQFYSTSNFISFTASETSGTCAGGFLNVPVGSTTVRAQIATAPDGGPASLVGRVIGNMTVPVISAAVTTVWFRARTH